MFSFSRDAICVHCIYSNLIVVCCFTCIVVRLNPREFVRSPDDNSDVIDATLAIIASCILIILAARTLVLTEGAYQKGRGVNLFYWCYCMMNNRQ